VVAEIIINNNYDKEFNFTGQYTCGMFNSRMCVRTLKHNVDGKIEFNRKLSGFITIAVLFPL